MDDKTYRAANERRMAEKFALALPAEQLALWNECKHAGRFFFTAEDTFRVVEVYRGGRSTRLLSEWRVESISAHAEYGFTADLVNQEGKHHKLSHVPSLLDGGVFVWIPPYAMDVRMVEATGISLTGYLMSLNIAFRSPHGPTYAVPVNSYLLKN